MIKRRPISHITGDRALDIVKSVLPSEWVIRSMTPDYGIDLLVELFDYVDKEKKICETLGEYLFVQVKGTTRLERRTIKIYPVYNVAKAEWKEDHKEYMEIKVVSFQLETALLETVKRVGASTCVLLFLVDVDKEKVYSICLNDLLDKYVQPRNPKYFEQASVLIDIPVDNEIDGSFESLVPLRLYGKRSKLYSAFSTIRYQLGELEHELVNPEVAFRDERPDGIPLVDFANKKLSDYILFFADQLLQLDIWSIGEHLFALKMCRDSLDKLVQQIGSDEWGGHFLGLATMYRKMGYDEEWIDQKVLADSTLSVWHQLDNMSKIYEEICREWFLPKFIGQLGSYPNAPKVRKNRNHK